MLENLLMQAQIHKRFSKLRPFEQQLLKVIIQKASTQNQSTAFWVDLSFATLHQLMGSHYPEVLAEQQIVKSLEALLFARGYFHATDHASLEYQFISGYKINPDFSIRIYLNLLIQPYLVQL